MNITLKIIIYAGIISNAAFMCLVFFTIGVDGEITITHVPEEYQDQWHWSVWIEFFIAVIILIGAFFFMKTEIDRHIIERGEQLDGVTKKK